MVFAISILSASALLVVVYHLSAMQPSRAGLYRLFLIVYFAVWSAGLWIKPHEPTVWLMVLCIALLGLLPVLALIPRKAPKNRRETKALLEQLQRERRLHKFFGTRAGRLFWPLLWCLIFSVCHRVLLIYFG